MGVFGFPVTATAPRFFAGVYGASTFAVDDGDPSARTNILGFAADVGQTNLRFITNDGAGSAVSTDLGANFPISAGSMYEFMIHCEPNGSAVEYFIRRLDAAFSASGTASADLPASTTQLAPQIGFHNGATAEAVEIDIMSIYYEMTY